MTVAEPVATPASEVELAAVLEPLVARAAGRDGPTLVSASLPIDAVDPVALYAVAQPLGASLWLQPAEGFGLVGIGQAWGARQSHAARFQALSVAWRMLLTDAIVDRGDAPRGAGPVLLGGFAFDPEPGGSALWEGFEPGHLSLPALLLSTSPRGSWLTATLVLEPGGVPAATMVGSLHETWRHLALAPPRPSGPARQTLRTVARQPEAATWRDSVARLAGAVGRGRLDKAVLSRRVTLRAAAPLDIPAVVRRLEASATGATIFAVTRGPRTFIGATPERLVRLDGREYSTMAMAGSARRTGDAEVDAVLAAELLESDKEREEHAVVVAMLRSALAPISEELSIAAAPDVVALRHVQHLVTPIRGRLREDADILSLVERLHPTPAVGGMPRELALELIAEEEAHERGWYAGPLGWVDRDGDGEFVVALRSGVIDGAEATLFAGCGIVADSDPDREWDESSAKLSALGSALGRIEP
jgi:isochorismate synthase